jgi:hypothetical protein
MARHMKSTWIPEQTHAAAGADLAKLEVLRRLRRRILGRMSKEECVGRVVPIFTHAIGRIEGENERAATRGVKDDVPVGREDCSVERRRNGLVWLVSVILEVRRPLPRRLFESRERYRGRQLFRTRRIRLP